jgi:hypothetical protein
VHPLEHGERRQKPPESPRIQQPLLHHRPLMAINSPPHSSLFGLVSWLLSSRPLAHNVSIAALAAQPLLTHSQWRCEVVIGGVDGWFWMPSLDEWPSSVGFLPFCNFQLRACKKLLPPRRS